MTVDLRVSITGDVKRLALQPGDKLLFTTPDHLNSEDVQRLSAELEHLFPGHKAIIISGPGKLEVMA